MNRRVSKEEYINRVNNVHIDCYELISEFVNMTTKITMKHRCGNEITAVPSVFLREKEYCRECSNKKLSEENSLSIDNIIKIVESYSYRLLSNTYKNSREKINFKCNYGHEFSMIWNSFQKGRRCPKCKFIKQSERQKFPLRDVYKFIDDLNYTFIEFPNGYVNRNSKVTVECENNHISTKTIASIIVGNGCPHCNNPSKQEIKICEYLTNRNIEFIQQYKFDDCINSRKLPFDFAIFDNGVLKFLIEYDGEQHFKPIEKFGGEEAYRRQVENDNIKSNYCKENNIKLIRISYKDKKRIEKVLDSVFK